MNRSDTVLLICSIVVAEADGMKDLTVNTTVGQAEQTVAKPLALAHDESAFVN